MKGTNHQTERGEMPLGGASAVEQSLAAIKVFPPGMKIEKITKPDIEVLDIGTLVQIGQGKFPADEIRRMLAKKDRRVAGMTAPAQGLVLWKVFY